MYPCCVPAEGRGRYLYEMWWLWGIQGSCCSQEGTAMSSRGTIVLCVVSSLQHLMRVTNLVKYDALGEKHRVVDVCAVICYCSCSLLPAPLFNQILHEHADVEMCYLLHQ